MKIGLFKNCSRSVLTTVFSMSVSLPAFGSVECIITQTKNGVVAKNDKVVFVKPGFTFNLEKDKFALEFRRYNGSHSIAITERANQRLIARLGFFLSGEDFLTDQILEVPAAEVTVTCSGSV